MGLKVTNNAFGTLNAGITSSATTIVLAAGQGARFPSLGAGDYFYATLIDTSNNLEIVKVTARSTDTMTVVRGQDGTTARAYSTNDRFELRPTAVMFTETIDKADAALPKAGGVMTNGGRIQFQNSDGHTMYGIRATRYGYSSGYRSLQIGDGSGSDNIALGVDVSAIAGGAFTGNGKDIVVPNGVNFSMPNSGNTDFITPMRFDAGGRVITPLQPSFLALLNSSGWSHPSGTTLIGGTWAASHNVGSHYNTGTRRFTAPVTGTYQFNGTIATIGGVGTFNYLSCEFWVNGSRTFIGGWDGGGPSYGQTSSSAVLSLNAGDYVELASEASKSFTLQGPNHTSFSGFLIG